MPFAQDDSCSAKMKDTCHRSPYGTMFVPSTDDRGEELLTWFREVFLAKTYRARELALESTGKEAGCGPSSLESFARYDHDSCSWKTRQCSLLGDLERYSETWPRWGMMRGGECWVLSMQEHRIDEIEFGLLPTQTATAYGSCQGGSSGRIGQRNRPSLQTMAQKGIFPTPRKSDAERGGRGDLIQVVRGNKNHHFKSYPTPTKSDATGGPGCSGRQGGNNLRTQVGGSLNPTWVEWLMGWPIGWTACEPLEMDKFLQWLRFQLEY